MNIDFTIGTLSLLKLYCDHYTHKIDEINFKREDLDG